MNLKGKGNENSMSLIFSRNVDALINILVITNEYNFKNNVFTNSFLLQCVFYDICIF